VEVSRKSFAGDHPTAEDGFSYASNTNDEWLSHEGLLTLLRDGAAA
jgi:hypothetical protein